MPQKLPKCRRNYRRNCQKVPQKLAQKCRSIPGALFRGQNWAGVWKIPIAGWGVGKSPKLVGARTGVWIFPPLHLLME